MGSSSDVSGRSEFKAAHFLAKEQAVIQDQLLRSYDQRLNGSVLLMHQDGSIFLFDRAFVQLWCSGDYEFAIVATEHHRTLVYPMDEVKHLLAIGPRLAIESLVEPKAKKTKVKKPKKAVKPKKRPKYSCVYCDEPMLEDEDRWCTAFRAYQFCDPDT